MGNVLGSKGNDKNPDGISTYPANAADMESYAQASRDLSKLSAPVFITAANPHERLYVAAFDGTGNHMGKDPEHITNVGQVFAQIELAIAAGNKNIAAGYVEGPGTQDNFLVRLPDLITGHTYEDRIELMYEKFTVQCKKWLDEDPNAQIRLADIGFSRGAEQAAGFARLVHERGIQDPDGRHEFRGEDGRMHIEYTKPPLVAPGQISQAVGLFDPVGTGTPRDHDRRLPPSVVSGFQITAEDERRNQFKSTNIIDPGMTENNHFLNVTVGGAHSNIGNSYSLNGLGVRSGNLMADYLNSLSEPPFLQKQAVPTDPAMNVVHRSEEHNKLVYRTSDFEKDNVRDRLQQVTSDKACKIVPDCNNKEPYDPDIQARHRYRDVPIAPQQLLPIKGPESQTKLDPTNPAHPDHKLHQQSNHAVRKLDESMGRAADANSDRMAASLTVLAKQEGIQRIDNVVLSASNGAVKAGENVIVVHGNLEDPSHTRAHMKTQLAVSTPVAESFKQLDTLNTQQRPELMQQHNAQVTRDNVIDARQLPEQEVQRQAMSR